MESKGFTIIELIIVVFIIIVLSVIVVANYEWGGYELELGQSAQQLVGDLQWAREKSISSGDKSYGVCLETQTSTYILFEDKDNDLKYDASQDILLERVRLRENILVTKLDIGVSTPTANIVFVPPEPLVRINTDKTYVYITLWSQKSNATTAVFVHWSGLVEIK
ncbi:GspH/FimT family protein [bacterium]|nr:GspH/FimT family protein [bacterium]